MSSSLIRHFCDHLHSYPISQLHCKATSQGNMDTKKIHDAHDASSLHSVQVGQQEVLHFFEVSLKDSKSMSHLTLTHPAVERGHEEAIWRYCYAWCSLRHSQFIGRRICQYGESHHAWRIRYTHLGNHGWRGLHGRALCRYRRDGFGFSRCWRTLSLHIHALI